ncbi:hypothetical protein PRIPAC_82384 [Pristionchus pacificus]|uniref:Uncharacterized protein n=1 Tax=Pristionchus pacificus TaxID=54126 RepID=A0A2A6CNV2_PRIPA|nr:hypothetical protein PRIPAC_82384 [Pristionchus pacificus]|eukprot:PDM79874.1 hypothetical protein PRIPAC_32453 [Pristionchus pacificus]
MILSTSCTIFRLLFQFGGIASILPMVLQQIPAMEILHLHSNRFKITIAIALVMIFAVIFLTLLFASGRTFTVIPPEPFIISAEPRTNKSIDISIVIVLANGTTASNYQSALNSVRKYSSLHGYRLLVENDDKYKECSRHKDKFFKRHCHTLQLMLNELRESSYVLFIDADVGVVNPNKLIEEFIEPEFDIYLYNRYNNLEYAAQYLIKNNENTREWIAMWADMEFTSPKSFHETDNVALHILMMHYLVPETKGEESKIGKLCHTIWEKSENVEDLFTLRACTRMMIGDMSEFPEERVKIFPKGQGWARDIWILRSRWSTDDFMLHDVREERLHPEKVPQDSVHYNLILSEEDKYAYPLAFPILNISETEGGKQIWTMDGRFLISTAWREKILRRLLIKKWKQQYRNLGENISKFMRIA